MNRLPAPLSATPCTSQPTSCVPFNCWERVWCSVTHLHELALAIPELNARGPQDRTIISLVAQTVTMDEHVRGTFRIVAGTPDGQSYAAEVARQHGLTFEQLEQLRADAVHQSHNGFRALAALIPGQIDSSSNLPT